MSQFHFDPDSYLAMMRADVPRYDELQDVVAAATVGLEVRRILELGTGTGETARRVLTVHPGARLVGIDSSEPMLEVAGADLDADLRVQRLEDPLPDGPFDLVVSALAVHHLEADDKRDLFRRVREALVPGGRFVLADVVVPERTEDVVTPATPGFDKPDSLPNLLAWLAEAGFETRVEWSWKDLAAVRADLPR
ncbi:MAG: class I SAM-dependent methyltransferase [Actinobacteria bacterium]|nr:class I SAM-dependent methyltransferase [Actinomycetota bacterium]